MRPFSLLLGMIGERRRPAGADALEEESLGPSPSEPVAIALCADVPRGHTPAEPHRDEEPRGSSASGRPALDGQQPQQFAVGTALGTPAAALGVASHLLLAVKCAPQRRSAAEDVIVGELLQWTVQDLAALAGVGWQSIATAVAAVDAVRLACPGETDRIYRSPLVASIIEGWGEMRGPIGGHAGWRNLIAQALQEVSRVRPKGFVSVPSDRNTRPFGPPEPAPSPARELRLKTIDSKLSGRPGTGLGVPLSDMLAYRGIGRPVANAMASEYGIPEKEVTIGHALGFGYANILRMKDVGRGALARILAAGDAARLACPDQAETVLISPLARSTAGRWPDVKRELGGKVVWPDEVARALERLHELLPPGVLRHPRSLPLYPFGRCPLPPGSRPPYSARPRLEITSRPVDRASVFSLPFLDLVAAPLRLREAMSAMGLADRDATLLDVLDLDKGDLLDCRRVGRKTIADLAAILDAIRCTCPSTDTEILRAQLVRTMLVDDPTWPVCDRGRPSYLEADGGRRWPYLVAAMSAGVVAALPAEMGPLPFSLPSRPFGALDGTGWLGDDRGYVVRRPRD